MNNTREYKSKPIYLSPISHILFLDNIKIESTKEINRNLNNNDLNMVETVGLEPTSKS